jgi:hypothetical protein
MRVLTVMPKKWRTLVRALEDWQDRLSIRLMRRIERMNRRMYQVEARWRTG